MSLTAITIERASALAYGMNKALKDGQTLTYVEYAVTLREVANALAEDADKTVTPLVPTSERMEALLEEYRSTGK